MKDIQDVKITQNLKVRIWWVKSKILVKFKAQGMFVLIAEPQAVKWSWLEVDSINKMFSWLDLFYDVPSGALFLMSKISAEKRAQMYLGIAMDIACNFKSFTRTSRQESPWYSSRSRNFRRQEKPTWYFH